MDEYAAAQHTQCIKGTMNGTHPKLLTGYVNVLKLRFKDKEAGDEADSDLERFKYDGCQND